MPGPGTLLQSALAQPELQDQPINESPDDMLTRLLIERLQAKPPAPPQPTKAEDFNLLHGMFMSRLTGPVFEQMMNQQAQKRPGYPQYQQEAAQYKAEQEQIPAIASILGRQVTQQGIADRQQMYRYVPGQLNYLDPVKGNVSLPVWRDRMTLGFYDSAGQPVQIPQGGVNMPIHFTPYTGPGGEMAMAPTSPWPQGPPQVPGVAQPPAVQAPGSPTGTAATIGGLVPGAGAPRVATPGNIRIPGGLPPRQAPESAIENVKAQGSFLQGMAPLFGLWKTAKEKVTEVTGEGLAGGLAQTAIGETAESRRWRWTLPHAIGKEPAQATIDYAQNLKRVLYQFVKAQTGAQFSITEMDRYMSFFPTLQDTEETAWTAIVTAAQKAVDEINVLKQNWHAIQLPDGSKRWIDPKYLQIWMRTGDTGSDEETISGAMPLAGTGDPIDAAIKRAEEKARAKQGP